MSRGVVTHEQLRQGLVAYKEKMAVDRACESSARNITALRHELASSLARASGWLSPAEKIAVLHRTTCWETIRSREQVDLLMAAGCYREAIPIFEALSHWRKIGDAQLALGDIDAARQSYERGENKRVGNYAVFRAGPDFDRLIALAIGREEWRETIDLVRQARPDPLDKNDVVFAGSSRAKWPLVNLCAHAAWRSGDTSILAEIPGFFGVSKAEVEIIFANASGGLFERDVAKLGKPGLLRVKPETLVNVLRVGDTPTAAKVTGFFCSLESDYRAALRNVRAWRSSGDKTQLDKAIFWLTSLGNYEFFHTSLFQLRCDLDAWIDPHPTDIEFYVSHPWLTRACTRDLLTSLIRGKRAPTPAVLLSCAIQHSASPFDMDFEKRDTKAGNMDQIRSQPAWAEAAVKHWSADGSLTEGWARVCAAADPNFRSDPRRLPAYGALCDEIVAALNAAWARDFNEIRWKAEEGAFLTLKAFLPEAEIIRHARPTWLAPQHLDIFLPEFGVAIEYQGEQHYRPIDIFGGAPGFAATVERDERKRRICSFAGIQLECIRYDESVDGRIRQIVKICQSKLGKSI